MLQAPLLASADTAPTVQMQLDELLRLTNTIMRSVNSVDGRQLQIEGRQHQLEGRQREIVQEMQDVQGTVTALNSSISATIAALMQQMAGVLERVQVAVKSINRAIASDDATAAGLPLPPIGANGMLSSTPTLIVKSLTLRIGEIARHWDPSYPTGGGTQGVCSLPHQHSLLNRSLRA